MSVFTLLFFYAVWVGLHAVFRLTWHFKTCCGENKKKDNLKDYMAYPNLRQPHQENGNLPCAILSTFHVRAHRCSTWNLHIEVAHRCSTWNQHVEPAHGSCTWNLHMEPAYGTCTWNQHMDMESLHMESAHGTCT